MEQKTNPNPKSGESDFRSFGARSESAERSTDDSASSRISDKTQYVGAAVAESATDAAAFVGRKAEVAASYVGHKAEEAADFVGRKAEGAASYMGHKAENAASIIGRKTSDVSAAAGSRLQALGETVRDHCPEEGVAGEATAAVADTLESSGRYLQEEGFMEMAQDLTNLVRRNPIASLLIGVSAGYLVGKAMAPRS